MSIKLKCISIVVDDQDYQLFDSTVEPTSVDEVTSTIMEAISSIEYHFGYSLGIVEEGCIVLPQMLALRKGSREL